MSGGGGGGGYGSSRSNMPKENLSCKEISFNTQLRSPNPVVLKRIKGGFLLEIELDPNTGAVVALSNGVVAGSLTGTQITSILRCMALGYTFTAEVVRIEGGMCEVLITYSYLSCNIHL